MEETARAGADRPDIRSLLPDELKEAVLALGFPAFRARQIFSWLHEKRVTDFHAMTNLSKAHRNQLAERFLLPSITVADMQVSRIDGTRKYLFALPDGNVVECVRMAYHHGISVCISTQAGCRMGCSFCASTQGGLIRGLTAGEMLSEVYRVQEDETDRVSHVVLMGSGEPFDNYEAVVRFLRLISHPDGANLSLRNITVSTCGLVPEIRRFAGEGLPVTLALSLHAPSDAVRRKLMPIAARYSLNEVLDACSFYAQTSGRRVTFEYSLVRGINDSQEEARALSRLLRNRHGHVNLIPVNPIRERDYVQPQRERILAFQHTLEKNGIPATIRREMGRDIEGACGQLRRSYLAKKEQQTDGHNEE